MKGKNSIELLDKIRIIVYRYNQKGLEIFLMPIDELDQVECLKLSDPQGLSFECEEPTKIIELDTIKDDQGALVKTVAIEGEWHDIPSIRKMIKQDLKLVKYTIKEMVPGIEKGAFFAVKEAVKKVMPAEYTALKELKDILLDRNTVRNI